MLDQEKLGELFEMLSHDTGIDKSKLFRNPSVAVLVENAIKYEPGSAITSTGALLARSGNKCGRSPADKRVVNQAENSQDIWWGPVNIKLSEHVFDINRERAVDYLKTRDRIYIFDGFAGWHPKYRLKIRVVCMRAYHALFMHNMLIRPTEEELDNFGTPDFTVLNAGAFPANKHTSGMTSQTSVDVCFGRKEMVILGTEYAGEMKKGIFTVMHYLMPKRGVLSLHSSANEGDAPDDVSVFFGLSGTGKTTLSADPKRKLIGDDEHCWCDDGIFNIEGGCYAKCIDLDAAKEPEIFDAIRFGSVLENVVLDPVTRVADYADKSITENTRCAYPIEFIPNAKVPCIAGHPKNIFMLTCDAYGVLPPVSHLSSSQAMYHFISGYTAKIPGTEEGITDPTVTFSTCFGQPFIVWHPMKYAQMLADRMHQHSTNVWLINTGWVGGAYGVGQRISLKYTRAIIDAIHTGEMIKGQFENSPVFDLQVPVSCPGVPTELLHPERSWASISAYNDKLDLVARKFVDNFKQYMEGCTKDVIDAGPKLFR